MNIQEKSPKGAMPQGISPDGGAESNAGSGLSKINEIAKYVQNFADFGLIDNEQKEFLCQKINAAMETLNGPGAATGAPQAQNPDTSRAGAATNPQNPDVIDFERLSDDENNFFETRQSLKAYLSQTGVTLTREEFEKIFALVNELEKQALTRFASALQAAQEAEMVQGQGPQEFEAFLKGRETLKQVNERANDAAKQKLQTASAGAFGGPIDTVKKFTPEQIGAMSTKQFIANEPFINEQIKNGEFGRRR